MSDMGSSLHINPNDGLPVYQQIKQEMIAMVAARRLRPGDRLMPYRELAELLVVSPLAARKAYEDLEAEGLCEPDGQGGFRVVSKPLIGMPAMDHGTRPAVLEAERLTAEELESARDIQCRLMPPTRVEGDGFRVAARNFPAHFVAGDFYDVREQSDGRADVVVADVAGKGIGTSLIMASVQAMTPFIAAGRSVEETLGELNRTLYAELGPRDFVALAYARFEASSGTMEIANAGLPDPYLLRPGEVPQEISIPGPRLPLGVRPQVVYESLSIDLDEGDRLFLYSDGIPESMTADGEPLGYKAVAELLRDVHEEDGRAEPDRWLGRFLDRVLYAAGRGTVGSGRRGSFEDDLTALVFERRREGG
jgi:DNA-binding transcriptional regulator YhcF (GntR family)